jgi:hypothetical protein
MTRKQKKRISEPVLPRELDLFQEDWLALTPWERLARSWALRDRLPAPQAVHDEKLFPKP